MSHLQCLCLAFLLLTPMPALPAEPRPNVVFILADDLGVNDLGCYGRKEHHTPGLDGLAKHGARFTCAYAACPVCSPTRAAIMTGKNPARLHLTTFLPGRGDAPSQKLLHPKIRQNLPLGELTIAESLKAVGYATACIGKWHLGGRDFTPDKQGFDFVHVGKPNTTPTADEGGKGETDLTQKAVEFITANRDRPFFLYLCHNTPHIPLGASTGLIDKYKDTYHPKYAAMMDRLDHSVGTVLNTLDELKVAQRTLVIFTSDNGGLHVPEGRDPPPTHNTPFRAGKGFLYEGGIRVPLLVRWPGTLAPGRIIHTPVISMDWTPTILEACAAKSTVEHDGASLVGLLKGESLRPRPFFWHVPHYMNQGSRPAGAVRDGDWKLIEHYEDGRRELFELARDPAEANNLAAMHPDRAAALHARLADWRTKIGAQMNQPNPDFDAERHRRVYMDMDVSMAKPGATAVETGNRLADWRRAIDARGR
jgi:arylsulfatase A-like enzyme